MKRYVIERNIAGVDRMTPTDLNGAAKKSNDALKQLQGLAQWVHSYVVKDKTFCIYLAKDEDAIREHSRLSGFPADVITEVKTIIDPTTERA